VAAAVRIRVRLCGGEVTVEDGDCFGLPVVDAARLYAAAPAGQLLASDVVRLLVGARAGPRFIPVGSLQLKGLPDLVVTVEVEKEAVAGRPRVVLVGSGRRCAATRRSARPATRGRLEAELSEAPAR
jgi:class 3 adenylate cyclase